jgi:catechol 2,3-dioxygenase-like lactoylglutathione lyase family enzyme
MSHTETWPPELPVVQLRIARPTDRLEEVVRFYTEGLGLKHLGGFKGHAGYDGVFISLPGHGVHLEFTRHEAGSPCPAPTRDNLLVLYIPDRAARDVIVARLTRMGFAPVEPENPYWRQHGVTVEDPDGWRVVLQNTHGLERPGSP